MRDCERREKIGTQKCGFKGCLCSYCMGVVNHFFAD